MRFLLDDDDDWQEGSRRFWFPLFHLVLEPLGLYGTGTTRYSEYVGKLDEDEEVIEEELVALGFERNPLACYKSLPDGRRSEGSWALRSHDAPDLLDRDRQLHLTLFEREDGEPGRELFAHEEYDWQDAPVRHLRGTDMNRAGGACLAADLIEFGSDLVLR